VMTHDLSDETVARLHYLANDTIELEQYLDFARHQTFRRTLLCHDNLEVHRNLRGQNIRSMYIASRAQLVSDNDGNEYFRTHDGSTYPAEHPVTTAALRYLGEISPRAAHFDTLLNEACKRAGMSKPTEEAADVLSTDLLEAFTYSTQLAELLTYDPVFTPIPSERPKVSPIVRIQIHTARIVSNLRHEQVELDGLSHAVMPFLDGTRTRADLLRELMEMVDAGQLGPSQQPGVTRDQIEKQLAHDLEYTLRWLGRAAVLLE
jgi:methyltransferase-like protein